LAGGLPMVSRRDPATLAAAAGLAYAARSFRERPRGILTRAGDARKGEIRRGA